MNKGQQLNMSILIKTFNRKKSLIRLLHSIEKLTYTLPVLIADDSKEPYREEILSRFPGLYIAYYNMPFDSGLSAGRNLLLTHVKTPYFLLCDDDFRFNQSLNLPDTLQLIESQGVDIAGGILFNHITVTGIKRFLSVLLKPRTAFRYIFAIPSVSRYFGNFSVQNGSCRLLISNSRQEQPVHACELVNNFFIARTNKIQEINGWDESFKVGEHEDFFYRAKLAGLKVALVESLAASHYPGARKGYLAFRERSFELKKHFPRKFRFSEYREINIDNNSTIFLYRHGEENDNPYNQVKHFEN